MIVTIAHTPKSTNHQCYICARAAEHHRFLEIRLQSLTVAGQSATSNLTRSRTALRRSSLLWEMGSWDWRKDSSSTYYLFTCTNPRPKKLYPKPVARISHPRPTPNTLMPATASFLRVLCLKIRMKVAHLVQTSKIVRPWIPRPRSKFHRNLKTIIQKIVNPVRLPKLSLPYKNKWTISRIN